MSDVDDPDLPPDAASETTGPPRWVKVLVAAVLVLVLALVISKLAGVDHGPGMHGGDSDAAPTTHTGPPAGVEGHVPPGQTAP